MGERGNIVIAKDKNLFPHPVFFYTHWRGYQLKPILKAALVKGSSRWDDSQYLARVIFCELVGSDADVTGFGITTRICDSGYKLLCVHMEENKIRELDSADDLNAAVLHEWTFQEFCAVNFDDDLNDE